MWFDLISLTLAILGAWDKLLRILGWLVLLPGRLVTGTRHVVTCGMPLSMQLAECVDNIGLTLTRNWEDPFAHPKLFTAANVTLTTWLLHPTRAVESYRRHLQALRECEGALRARAQLAS